jgi:hypothetical protein
MGQVGQNLLLQLVPTLKPKNATRSARLFYAAFCGLHEGVEHLSPNLKHPQHAVVRRVLRRVLHYTYPEGRTSLPSFYGHTGVVRYFIDDDADASLNQKTRNFNWSFGP